MLDFEFKNYNLLFFIKNILKKKEKKIYIIKYINFIKNSYKFPKFFLILNFNKIFNYFIKKYNFILFCIENIYFFIKNFLINTNFFFYIKLFNYFNFVFFYKNFLKLETKNIIFSKNKIFKILNTKYS